MAVRFLLFIFCLYVFLNADVLAQAKSPLAPHNQSHLVADDGRWSLLPLTDELKSLAQTRLSAVAWEKKAESSHPRLKSLFYLASALAWFRQGLYYRAQQAFERSGSANSPLRDVQLFFWGESLFHQGQYQAALNQYQSLAQMFPGSLWNHRAIFRQVDTLQALGKIKESSELLARLLAEYHEYPYRKAAILQMSHLTQEAGDLLTSQLWLKELTPGSFQDVMIQRGKTLQSDLIPLEEESFEEKLTRVQTWRKWKYYVQALQEVKNLLADLTPKKHQEKWRQAAIEHIRILNKMEKFEQAIIQNDRYTPLIKSQGWKRINLWWKAQALFRLHRVEEAADVFKKSRGNPNTAGNLARLGMIYFDGAYYEEAEEVFKKAVERGEKGDPDLYMARRLLTWLPYRLKRYAQAADKFKRMCHEGRGSNHYAHYWWARSLQKLDREEDAKVVYQQLIHRAPYSFYAYAAQKRLKELGVIAEVSWDSFPHETKELPVHTPLPHPLEALQPLASEYGDQLTLWDSIYGLSLIGETRWAMIYLRALTEENRSYFRSSGAKRRRWEFTPKFYLDYRDDIEYGIWGLANAKASSRSKSWTKGISALRPTVLRRKLVNAYRALGDHYYGRRAAYYDGPSLHYPEYKNELSEWQRRYPRSFKDAVVSSAARYAVDPHLIWALMTVESSHNPWAISPVGARGLMQVMPHTGQLSADRMQWAYFGSPLLFEPEVAVEMAAWYFHQLTKEFHGQLPLAMSAYNAGPHRVKVWLEFKGDLPLDEFIEEIPYAQAREYGKKVTKYLALYRRIYQGHTGHLFDFAVNPFPKEAIPF